MKLREWLSGEAGRTFAVAHLELDYLVTVLLDAHLVTTKCSFCHGKPHPMRDCPACGGHEEKEEAIRKLTMQQRDNELRLAVLSALVKEVATQHRDPNSPEYNECDKGECLWCEAARMASND